MTHAELKTEVHINVNDPKLYVCIMNCVSCNQQAREQHFSSGGSSVSFRSAYLLDLDLLVQQLLSGQFHRELTAGEEHRVSVLSLTRAWYGRLSAAFPW